MTNEIQVTATFNLSFIGTDQIALVVLIRKTNRRNINCLFSLISGALHWKINLKAKTGLEQIKVRFSKNLWLSVIGYPQPIRSVTLHPLADERSGM